MRSGIGRKRCFVILIVVLCLFGLAGCDDETKPAKRKSSGSIIFCLIFFASLRNNCFEMQFYRFICCLYR